MDQAPIESMPEMPRSPEKLKADIDNAEKIEASREKMETTMPGERMQKASDAVSQAIVLPIQTDSDVNSSASQIVTVPQDNVTYPAIADDVDVIEKEWVQKAKEIVEATKDDPYQQSNRVSFFKHDYMKKRYGKEIKLPNEVKK